MFVVHVILIAMPLQKVPIPESIRGSFTGYLTALLNMRDSGDARRALDTANVLLGSLGNQEREFRATLLFEVGSAIALNEAFQSDLRAQALEMLKEASILRELDSPPLERSLALMALAKALPRERSKEAIESLRIAVNLLKALPEQLDYGVAVQALSLRLADGGSDHDIEEAKVLAQESIDVLGSNRDPKGAILSIQILGQISLVLYDKGLLDSLMTPFECQLQAKKFYEGVASIGASELLKLASSIVDVAEICLTGLQSLIKDWNDYSGRDLRSKLDWSKNPVQLDQELVIALNVFEYLKDHPVETGQLLTSDPELRGSLDILIDELLVATQKTLATHPLGYRFPSLTPGLSVRLTRNW